LATRATGGDNQGQCGGPKKKNLPDEKKKNTEGAKLRTQTVRRGRANVQGAVEREYSMPAPEKGASEKGEKTPEGGRKNRN